MIAQYLPLSIAQQPLLFTLADPFQVCQKKLKRKTMFEQALCLYSQRDLSKAAKLFQQCLEFVPEDKTAKIYLQRCHN